MVSEAAPAPVAGEVNATVQPTENRPCPGKSKGKVPKRIHKAEREKLKREQLNDLFLDLANALELTQPNNGKALVLCEATRLLKELAGQIECLKKENASLLSESHYVTAEKDELKEENSALQSQVEKLQSELDTRVAQSKPDLNAPLSEIQQPQLTPHFPGESLGASDPLQQAPAIFVFPCAPLQQAYGTTTSNVSKPHPRYPTAADSWPSKLLGEQVTATNALQLSGSDHGGSNTGE